MSVAARSARPRRRLLAACAGAAVLALSTAACGFDDRAAVGTVTYAPKAEEAAAEEGHDAKPADENPEGEHAGHGEAADGQEGHGESGHAESGEAEAGHGEAAAEEGGHGAEAEGTTLTNPKQKGCHVLKGGAHTIENRTLNDLVAYVGTDCTGESKHIGSKLAGDLAPQAESWHSFKFVS
ncbi:hypothetical protein [Streptomyces sp. NPDC002851]